MKGTGDSPFEFRDMGHEVVTTTKAGVLFSPGKKDFIEFLKLIGPEPRRTGMPANPSPSAMKGIWREKA
jgi:hypothetical protein